MTRILLGLALLLALTPVAHADGPQRFLITG